MMKVLFNTLRRWLLGKRKTERVKERTFGWVEGRRVEWVKVEGKYKDAPGGWNV